MPSPATERSGIVLFAHGSRDPLWRAPIDTVVPMFLGTGRHAREDLPRLVATLRQRHPEVSFAIQRPVGEDPRITALMAMIATETGTRQNQGPISP